MDITAESSDFKNHSRADRIGIWASVLCAIHCALTPIFLIMLPAFGKAWAHPATHWGMALVVIPIAVLMMRKGYQKHGKKWVLAVGAIGIVLIVIGSALPYMESEKLSSTPAAACETTGCVDQCCPSMVVNEQGEKSLHIPPASIVTSLGGLCLIIVHAVNLCSCSCCKHPKKRTA